MCIYVKYFYVGPELFSLYTGSSLVRTLDVYVTCSAGSGVV